MQSNTVVSKVNIPKPRRLWSWTYKINKEAESRIRQESTPNAKRRSNWTRKDARQIETGLLVETKHMATSFKRQRRESLRTRLSTWPMKITSFSLNNFAPEEFFGGAKSVSMKVPKFSNATALWRRSPLSNANSICHGSRFAESSHESKKKKQYNSSYSELGPPVAKRKTRLHTDFRSACRSKRINPLKITLPTQFLRRIEEEMLKIHVSSLATQFGPQRLRYDTFISRLLRSQLGV